MRALSGCTALLALCSALAHHSPDHEGSEYKAVAYIRDFSADSVVTGNVTFTQHEGGALHVEGTIVGLPRGKYGFHIHEKGDITGGCLSTKGHYNPHKKSHGAPEDANRHVGDLGNIEFDEHRIARVSLSVRDVFLVGEFGVVGRALVLHSGADDLGRGAHPDSLKTGNAGGRVACGVIGILDPAYAWKPASSSRRFSESGLVDASHRFSASQFLTAVSLAVFLCNLLQ